MKIAMIKSYIVLILINGLVISCSGKSTNTNKKDTISNEVVEKENISPDTKDVLYDIMDNWLKINTPQSTIIERLGEPETKGTDEYWGALGTYVQKWEYQSKGISMEMESDEQNTDKKVLMITITSPCSMSTSKGISIGSKKEDVIKKYSSEISSDFSTETQIVVGSIYGGVIFDFKEEVVTKIFIGAAAE